MSLGWVIIALLDGAALGGLAGILLARQLLLTIMARLVAVSAQAELLNVHDQLLPYVLGSIFLVAGMLCLTVLAGVATHATPRGARPESARSG